MKMKILVVLVLLAFVLASCGPAKIVPNATSMVQLKQASIARAQQLISWPGLHSGWMNFTGTGGLLSDFTYDPNGYLWALGYSTGVIVRWDLKTGEMTTYTSLVGIPNGSSYLTLFQGKPWIVAEGGRVATYSGQQWITPTISTQLLEVSNNFSGYLFSNTGDRLWVSWMNGTYYFDGQTWQSFDQIQVEKSQLQCSGSFKVSKSHDGTLWFLGCGRVLGFDGQNWKSYDSLRGTDQIFTLSEGTLIFEINNNLVFFDGSRFQTVVLPGNPFGYTLYSEPLLNSNGDLWFQTQGDSGNPGFTYIIHNGQVQQQPALDFENAPAKSFISSTDRPMAVGPEGLVFFSESTQTAYLYDGKIWRAMGTLKDPWSNVVSLQVIGFAPDGTLWVINQNGLPARFDGQKLESPFQDQSFQDQNSHCQSGTNNYVVDSKGSIWGWSQYDRWLCYFDPVTNQALQFELFFHLDQLVAARDGGVWAASDAGFIAHLSRDLLESRDYRKLSLIHIGGDAVQNIVSPTQIAVGSDGAIWVFATRVGAYRYDGKDWKYLGPNGLQDSSAATVSGNDQVWLGGLNELDNYNGEIWQMYPKNDILPSTLTLAPDGAVWVVTNNDGVYRLDGSRWTQFTRDQIGNFTPNQILVAPDGALWFIGSGIWTRYMP
jgi:streptogramin lyase